MFAQLFKFAMDKHYLTFAKRTHFVKNKMLVSVQVPEDRPHNYKTGCATAAAFLTLIASLELFQRINVVGSLSCNTITHVYSSAGQHFGGMMYRGGIGCWWWMAQIA
jgi:hypothetical protein